MRNFRLGVIAALILIGCSDVTDLSRAETGGPNNPPPPVPEQPPTYPPFPGSGPVAPGFRAVIYGAEWRPDAISVMRDTTSNGAVIITAVNTTGSWVKSLRLRMETTLPGTYSLAANGGGSSVNLVIRYGDTSNFIDLSSHIFAGGGLAEVLSASLGEIAGKFIGNADGYGGSGEVISFVGEFNVALPPN